MQLQPRQQGHCQLHSPQSNGIRFIMLNASRTLPALWISSDVCAPALITSVK